jgi:hypothetical protein
MVGACPWVQSSAALAAASMVFDDRDGYSASLLSKAQTLYTWAVANPGAQSRLGFSLPTPMKLHCRCCCRRSW